MMLSQLTLRKFHQSPHTVATALFLAAMPASQVHADFYSVKITPLSPQYYLRLAETTTTPGATAANNGTGANALYATFGGSTTTSTGTNEGAISGNAGITTTGWSVRIPDSTLASGTEAFSFNFFAKPTSFAVNDYGTLLSYGEFNGASMLLTEDGAVGGGTGKLTFGRGGLNVFTSTSQMTAGQWNAVGVTYNGSNTIKLYMNGALDTTYTNASIDGFNNRYAVLGAFFNTGGQSFLGGLDEFTYIKGSALTDSQMIDIQAVPEPSTVVGAVMLSGLIAFSLHRGKRQNSQEIRNC